MLKHFLEAALAGELEAHLQEEQAAGLANRKNGKATKRVKSLSGEFDLETSRDRSGSFEPLVLPKRQLLITAELEEKVIGWYGLGLSTRAITRYVKEMQEDGHFGGHLIGHHRQSHPGDAGVAEPSAGIGVCLCVAGLQAL